MPWMDKWWMDGRINGGSNKQIDRLMVRPMDGQCFSLIQTHKMQLKIIIFKQIWQFWQKHYGRTNRRTNGPTDQRTEIPSYRDAIAASKKPCSNRRECASPVFFRNSRSYWRWRKTDKRRKDPMKKRRSENFVEDFVILKRFDLWVNSILNMFLTS